MLVLGLSGGLNLVHENPYDLPNAFTHDGAAVILDDGEILAAIEEERLNRIKHSNKFPVEAIRFCLGRAGAHLADVDRIAFYATEDYCNALLTRLYVTRPDMTQRLDARTALHAQLERAFHCEVDPGRITFVRHHMAHALSAFALSGFERSLVLAIDGYGDFLSGMVAIGEGSSLTEIETFPQRKSLGVLYLDVIQFLGYRSFDEYKVMGLAPYGHPGRYRDVFRTFYELLPRGGYELYLDRIPTTLLEHVDVRKKGQPFTQQHKDVAAALQETLETIVLHVLRHHRYITGEPNLCLAGGVAHNCTMNGKILYSGLFEQVFVQPAAHDAGCALGAALLVAMEKECPIAREPLRHVYWGTHVGSEAAIVDELERWRGLVKFERSPDVASLTARLLAAGAVVGWVQGRSEFGPRALGNRSILADPRPAENKDRINQMVKKREAYRPFAPSVLGEDARDFFVLPAGTDAFPFMIFVVDVREEKRSLLGAITHVDGTARLQTVSRETNRQYWDLIKAFKDLTGVPVLLNTSFNNNAEPIVDSVEDAVVTFLTTDLDCLVVGDVLVTKAAPRWEDRLALRISLPPYATVHQTRTYLTPQRSAVTFEMRTTYDARLRVPVSATLGDLLMKLEDEQPIGDLLAATGASAGDARELVGGIEALWAQRLVKLRPPSREERLRAEALSRAFGLPSPTFGPEYRPDCLA